jgi:carnitine O-acetyltransferase
VADWFDCLDSQNRPLLKDREILGNLQAIVKDADKTPVREVCSFQQPGCYYEGLMGPI